MGKVIDTFNHSVDSGYDIIGKFISYANSSREKITKQIVNSILLLIIFAIFGCFDFLTMSFHMEYLGTANYWTRVISKSIAAVCAYNIGINLSWDRELEKDLILRENADKYQRLNRLRDNETFNAYVIDIYNPNEKKKAYISKINRQLYWLDKVAKNKDKLLYSYKCDDTDKMKEIELQRSKNWYCVKRKELEQLKSEEYIKENLDSINVRYNFVDPIIFDLELDGKSSYQGVKVKGSVYSGRIRSTFSVLIGMIGISMFISSIGLDASQEQALEQMTAFWHYLLTCAEDVGIIIWQTLRGIFGSRKLISSEITQPLIGRNQVLMSYIQWCNDNHIETSKSKKIYDKLVEIEEKEKEESEAKIDEQVEVLDSQK